MSVVSEHNEELIRFSFMFSLSLILILTVQVGGQTKEQTFTLLLPTEHAEHHCVCVLCALLSSVYVSLSVSSSFSGFLPTVSGELHSSIA